METTGANLANDGADGLKALLKKIDDAGGCGVLFIDEAYQLDPQNSQLGRQALNLLLTEVENRKGRLVVVLAGYQKDMEKLFEYNEGLPRRFPIHFLFEDYKDKELLEIFNSLLKRDKGMYRLRDPKYARIAMMRIGKGRSSVGFGNAGAVRNFFELAERRQGARIFAERNTGHNPDIWMFERDDLLSAKLTKEQLLERSDAYRRLHNFVGLRAVKEAVDGLVQLVATNAELEDREQPTRDVHLNCLFLGNPGTGKTTIAELYGLILRDLGLLSKGEFILKGPKDLLGDVLGASRQKTRAILDAARGCVLAIDEVYGLSDDPGSGIGGS